MKATVRRWLIFSTAILFLFASWMGIATQVKALSAEVGDGILTYGQSANTVPQWRTYGMVANTFGAAQNAASGTTPRNMTTKTSPTKQEAISGYVGSDNVLHIMCYDGTTWTDDWTVIVGGGGGQARFDIAYEKTTGDVMVVYSRNVATTNEMAYRTKPGSSTCGSANWAAAVNIDAQRTSGTVVMIRLEGSNINTSNTIGLAWSDSNGDLSAMEWTGASWAVAEPATALEVELERIGTPGDARSFDVAMTSTSGNFMIAWGVWDSAVTCTPDTGTNNGNCMRYAQYITGTGWVGPFSVKNSADEATEIDISAHPTSDELVMAAIGNRETDLLTAYWPGGVGYPTTDWNTFSNRDGSPSGPSTGVLHVATGWLRSTTNITTRAVIVYADGTAPTTNISWYTYSGATNSAQTDFVPTPTPGGFRWMDIQTDPLKTDQLMLVFSDANSDLFAKRLTMDGSAAFTWTDADGGAALEANLGQTTNSPFGFAFWRYVPGILGVDIVNGAGSPVGAPSFDMSLAVVANTCQTSTGELGIVGQRIRLTNTTTSPAWSLGIAATGGPTASWTSLTDNYDFNDSSGSPAGCGEGADADNLPGQLSINPSAGSITPKSGCTNTGVSLGSTSAFNEVTPINSITLMSGSSGTSLNCYWDLLGASLSQTIPAYQEPGAYTLNLTMTAVAN